MHDDPEKTTANICVVSYHANSAAVDKPTRGTVVVVCEAAQRLAALGHRVDWITSPDTIATYAHDAAFVPASQDDLPPTCRYVLPCQPYRLADVTLFAVAPEVWRNTELQTRLFSFLCLLQRELEWDVMHAMGDLTAVFVSVYTAQFLGIPVVVSYDDNLIATGQRQPFVWRWINRHVALASVHCEADRQRLLKASDLMAKDIQVIGAGRLGVETLCAERRHGRARSSQRHV